MTSRPTRRRRQPAAKAPKDLTSQEYRERAKQEKDRYANAVDVRTWVTLTFPTVKDLEAAQKKFGLAGNQEMIWFEDLNWEKYKLAEPKLWRGRQAPFKGRLPENPLLALPEPSGDLEADSREEVYALLAALEAADKHPTEPRASNIWTAIVFPREKTKKAWLADHGLARFGDIYLDGVAALKALAAN